MIEVGVFFGILLEMLLLFFSLFLPLHRSLVRVPTRAINENGNCNDRAHALFSLNRLRTKLAVDLTKSSRIIRVVTANWTILLISFNFISLSIYYQRTLIIDLDYHVTGRKNQQSLTKLSQNYQNETSTFYTRNSILIYSLSGKKKQISATKKI